MNELARAARGDEPALVNKARAGDSTAFTQLVGRHEHNIFRLARHITQSAEDAEDVLQETFLKAYDHLNDFQRNSKFCTSLVPDRRQPGADEAEEVQDGPLRVAR